MYVVRRKMRSKGCGEGGGSEGDNLITNTIIGKTKPSPMDQINVSDDAWADINRRCSIKVNEA